MAFAIELFADTRFVSTNSILVSVGSAMVGVMLMVTGIILYTMKALIQDNFRNYKNY